MMSALFIAVDFEIVVNSEWETRGHTANPCNIRENVRVRGLKDKYFFFHLLVFFPAFYLNRLLDAKLKTGDKSVKSFDLYFIASPRLLES